MAQSGWGGAERTEISESSPRICAIDLFLAPYSKESRLSSSLRLRTLSPNLFQRVATNPFTPAASVEVFDDSMIQAACVARTCSRGICGFGCSFYLAIIWDRSGKTNRIHGSPIRQLTVVTPTT